MDGKTRKVAPVEPIYEQFEFPAMRVTQPSATKEGNAFQNRQVTLTGRKLILQEAVLNPNHRREEKLEHF
jgi:hypothetical protein